MGGASVLNSQRPPRVYLDSLGARMRAPWRFPQRARRSAAYPVNNLWPALPGVYAGPGGCHGQRHGTSRLRPWVARHHPLPRGDPASFLPCCRSRPHLRTIGGSPSRRVVAQCQADSVITDVITERIEHALRSEWRHRCTVLLVDQERLSGGHARSTRHVSTVTCAGPLSAYLGQTAILVIL